MKEIQDTVQVAVANSIGITFSITECNDYLTFISLSLAIIFTIYKFIKYEKKETK